MKFLIRQGEPVPLARLMECLADNVKRAPQSVTVTDYKSTRRLEQNAYYWVMLTQVADWIYEHEGEPKDAARIHWEMKSLFQPVEGMYTTEIVLDGRVLEVELTRHKSTTKNSVSEMAEYTEKVIAYWALRGCQFTVGGERG